MDTSTERSVFISHSSKDSTFVLQVVGYLARCFEKSFCYEEHEKAGDVVARMQIELSSAKWLIFFVGSKTAESRWQQQELSAAQNQNKVCVPVLLPGTDGAAPPIPAWASFMGPKNAIHPAAIDAAAALDTAQQICARCDIPWRGKDGLPADPNLFTYEKDVITFYKELNRLHDQLDEPESARLRRILAKGCPLKWPTVARVAVQAHAWKANPLVPESVGNARDEWAFVRTSALHESSNAQADLTFPEAGPRAKLCFSPSVARMLRVAVMVAGGIAPGINAVIDGITQRHWLYADKGGYRDRLRVYGLINGFRGFDNWDDSCKYLVCDHAAHPEVAGSLLETPSHAHEGGSIIGTSRDEDLMDEAKREGALDRIVGLLRGHQIDILYVIAGDGGMRAAHAIWNVARGSPGRPLSVVTIPKTMDNDILWVWQSFGFMSAVEKAREVIEHLHTEISSNPRLGIVQLFGSVSGFVVSHAVLAGSTPNCHLALVPEIKFRLREVASFLKGKLTAGSAIPRGLIVMAETALPEDALEIVQAIERDAAKAAPAGTSEPLLSKKEAHEVTRFLSLRRDLRIMSGQTSDELRSACLKIVSRGLEFLLKEDEPEESAWRKLRVVTNEPRHIIRAIPPSCQDIITGRRLGSLAVDNAMAGYTDFMISQWLTEFVLVPLPLVVLGRKQIPTTGIFWKSVLAKTGSWGCFNLSPTG